MPSYPYQLLGSTVVVARQSRGERATFYSGDDHVVMTARGGLDPTTKFLCLSFNFTLSSTAQHNTQPKMDRLSLEDLSAILADYDFECSTRLKSLKLSSSSHLDSLARSTKSIIVQLPDAVRHLAIHVILSEYQGDLTRAERAETEKRLRAHHFPGPSVGGGKGKRSALEEEEEDDDDRTPVSCLLFSAYHKN